MLVKFLQLRFKSIKKIITELKTKRTEISLKESDLEESFVKGGGPGGQAVNKRNNAVWVRHIPSGIQVKCHKTRSLELNRHDARKLIIKELDLRLNGEASKSTIEEMKIMERSRIKKKKSKAKYANEQAIESVNFNLK